MSIPIIQGIQKAAIYEQCLKIVALYLRPWFLLAHHGKSCHFRCYTYHDYHFFDLPFSQTHLSLTITVAGPHVNAQITWLICRPKFCCLCHILRHVGARTIPGAISRQAQSCIRRCLMRRRRRLQMESASTKDLNAVTLF